MPNENAVTAFKRHIFDETTPSVMACPFPLYHDLREAERLARIVHEGEEILVLTHFEDVVEVLRNDELYSNRRCGGPKAGAIGQAVEQAIKDYPDLRELVSRLGEPAAPVLDLADPPEHTKQRKLISEVFLPQRLAPLQQMLKTYAHEVVDEFIDAGEIEFVEGFAAKIPFRVITDMLDVPEEMRPTFRRWTDDQIAVLGTPSLTVEDGCRIARTNVEFYEYFGERIREKRKAPGPDLLSSIVTANEVAEEKVSDGELLGIVHQLAGAGHETTRNLISGAALALAEDPDAADRLHEDPAKLGEFIEEILRLESPTQGLFRVATRDTQLAGTPIPEGSLIWLLYGAANRDPEKFPRPDSIDLERGNIRQHIAFGKGRHACVGASLARAEARIAMEAIIGRLKNLRIQQGTAPRYGRSYILRGMEELQLTFERR